MYCAVKIGLTRENREEEINRQIDQGNKNGQRWWLMANPHLACQRRPLSLETKAGGNRWDGRTTKNSFYTESYTVKVDSQGWMREFWSWRRSLGLVDNKTWNINWCGMTCIKGEMGSKGCELNLLRVCSSKTLMAVVFSRRKLCSIYGIILSWV